LAVLLKALVLAQFAVLMVGTVATRAEAPTMSMMTPRRDKMVAKPKKKLR
jgi:hypothetical protein